ncbi:hypothetical protein MUK42_18494 [Musa troglodytarum]|uniref:Uncharacterized protein n=1 Tax=Musa troglodytarum TaxID=320322 RepID=A0A9E7EXS5_9LILI|nr:hypothetical protein MUK42_18494 [Musa troglodytarum]
MLLAAFGGGGYNDHDDRDGRSSLDFNLTSFMKTSTTVFVSPSTQILCHPFCKASSRPRLQAANSATELVARPMHSAYPSMNSPSWSRHTPPMLALLNLHLEAPSKFNLIHPEQVFILPILT